jgi:hypothetical protein
VSEHICDEQRVGDHATIAGIRKEERELSPSPSPSCRRIEAPCLHPKCSTDSSLNSYHMHHSAAHSCCVTYVQNLHAAHRSCDTDVRELLSTPIASVLLPLMQHGNVHADRRLLSGGEHASPMVSLSISNARPSNHAQIHEVHDHRRHYSVLSQALDRLKSFRLPHTIQKYHRRSIPCFLACFILRIHPLSTAQPPDSCGRTGLGEAATVYKTAEGNMRAR